MKIFLLLAMYNLLQVSHLVLGIPTKHVLLQSSNFNVVDYGAVGDAQHDDSPAFLKAWRDVCGYSGDTPTLLIPEGKTFLLTPFSFQGPCRSRSVHVQIEGGLVAPQNRDAWQNCNDNTWIHFSFINNLVIDGSGHIDGKGSVWWTNNKDSFLHEIYQCPNNNGCDCPKALAIISCNGLQLRGITSLDSPSAHISISGCNNAIISNLRILAPETSHNTDGIDISSSNHVQISDSFIATGDDCIGIETDVSDIVITGITCGPGHGISIGSLGQGGKPAKVEQVHVSSCTFNGTMNGARIKTWQGGSGYARNITFENIPLLNVLYPIIIDQHYCNARHDCPIQESVAEIESVTYRGFHGTSTSPTAITLNCSSTVACKGIFMESINIISSDPSKPTIAFCENAKGTQEQVAPQVPCLSH